MGSAVLTSDLSDYRPVGGKRPVATSIGWLARNMLRPGRNVGKVHSVFSSAFNVETPRKRLMGVTRTQWRYGLNITIPPEVSWPCLASGMAVVFQDGTLQVPEADVAVCLENAPVWKASMPISRPAADSKVVQATRSAARIGYSLGELAGLGGLLMQPADYGGGCGKGSSMPGWVARADAAVKELFMALDSRDPDEAARAGRFLAGLGPGLTPSGDDLLTGLVGALWWREKVYDRLNIPLRRCFAAIARGARDRTNVFGFREISCAAMGELPETALNVVSALLSGDMNLDSRVSALLALGSSSGTDMLAGVCLALARTGRT